LSDNDQELRIVIKETFEQCKRDGQIGEKFLYRLREAAPEDLYKDLLSEGIVSWKNEVNVADLPLSWSSKVKARGPRIQKRDKPALTDRIER
jgi:hypothetical protein